MIIKYIVLLLYTVLSNVFYDMMSNPYIYAELFLLYLVFLIVVILRLRKFCLNRPSHYLNLLIWFSIFSYIYNVVFLPELKFDFLS